MYTEDPQKLLADQFEGEHRKTDALGRFEDHRKQLLLVGRRALITHALQHGTATADDVRDVVPVPPGVNPKAYGAVPRALAKLGIIEACGFRRTARAAGHARPVMLWRIMDTSAAMRWLADHPDPFCDVKSQATTPVEPVA